MNMAKMAVMSKKPPTSLVPILRSLMTPVQEVVL